MQITIVTVGKTLSGPYLNLAEQYQQRLVKDVTVQWHYVSAAISQNPDECRVVESLAIEKYLKSSDTFILLDERGKAYTNQSFAEIFEKYAGLQGRLVFVIGGAFGVTESLRDRSTIVWSLSPLVFPHQLVRVIVMEQLYRTIQLQKGHPYHHA